MGLTPGCRTALDLSFLDAADAALHALLAPALRPGGELAAAGGGLLSALDAPPSRITPSAAFASAASSAANCTMTNDKEERALLALHL